MKQLLCLGILAVATVARADEPIFPAPPKGFAWKKADEIGAYFLMPDGWHYRVDTKGKTTAVFITKEKIEDGKPFQVGLSVNVIRGLKGPTAETMAKGLGEQYSKMGTIEKPFDADYGKVKGGGGQLTVPAKNVTMQFLVLANLTTGTLYVIQFESPQKDWEQAWTAGKEIMAKLALDDEI